MCVCGLSVCVPSKKGMKAHALDHLVSFYRRSRRVHIMNVEEQVRKTHQSLNNVASNVTQLTFALVSKVVETPQLYVNTKIRLLNSIGSLSEGVMDIQEAWEEMNYQLKRTGLAFPLEENESETRKKVTKRTADKILESAENGATKRGRKRKVPLPESSMSLPSPAANLFSPEDTKKTDKTLESVESGATKRGRKKKGAMTVPSPSASVPMEESIHDQVPFLFDNDIA